MAKKTSFFSVVLILSALIIGVFTIGPFYNKNNSVQEVPNRSQYSPAIKITNNTELVNFLPGQTGPGDSWVNAYIIEDLQINAAGSGAGLHLKDIDLYVIIQNSIIISTVPSGLYTGGIQLTNCTNIRILNSTASDYHNGIFVIDSSLIEITRNAANDNREDGIHILDSTFCDMEFNDAKRNNYYGITIKKSNNNTVYENTVKDNSVYGVYLEDSHSNRIEKNTIKDNFLEGIYLTGSDYNWVVRNRVIGNGRDITDVSGVANTIERNKTNYLLEIGLGSGGVIIIAGLTVFFIIRKKKRT